MQKNKADYMQMYISMKRIRMVEDAIAEKYKERDMHTPIHLCSGQEAIAVGTSVHMQKNDAVFSNHRSHGHYLAKGGNLKRLIAELYNKQTGCCKGRGGSMHLYDEDITFELTSSIVAGNISVATGWAFAETIKKSKNVAIAYLGDAASEEGNVYESICFAALKKIPIVYVCENNLYSICTPLEKREPRTNITDKFSNILETAIIDGNSIFEVEKTMEYSINKARMGIGPSFVECKTYRLRDHHNVTTGVEKGYRTQQEWDNWNKRSPILLLEKDLCKNGILNMEKIEEIEKKISFEIEEAFSFAVNSELPDEKEVYEGLWR